MQLEMEGYLIAFEMIISILYYSTKTQEGVIS